MDDARLLTALVQDPSPSALRVYADALLERGEPQGEFIELQLERTERGGPPSAREEALRRDVLEDALRATLGPRLLSCAWEHGFLSSICLAVDEGPLPELGALAERPEARLLRRLELDATGWHGEGELSATWASLSAAPRFPRLAALEARLGLRAVGTVAPLYTAYPALQALTLEGRAHDFGALVLPELRRFSAAVLEVAHVKDLVRAHWPKLEELELEFGPAGGEAEPIFGPLLAARMSPVLRRVRIQSPWPDFFRAALPRSPLGRGRVVEV